MAGFVSSLQHPNLYADCMFAPSPATMYSNGLARELGSCDRQALAAFSFQVQHYVTSNVLMKKIVFSLSDELCKNKIGGNYTNKVEMTVVMSKSNSNAKCKEFPRPQISPLPVSACPPAVQYECTRTFGRTIGVAKDDWLLHTCHAQKGRA